MSPTMPRPPLPRPAAPPPAAPHPLGARPHGIALALGLAIGLGVGLPEAALAQYKIVGPDGKVTYTDRPPAAGPSKAAPVPLAGGGDSGANASASTGLPYVLAQAANRYPATLYTGAGCSACDSARSYLRQRGIPFAEKVAANGDGDALQRLTGGRSIPVLTLGGQVVQGWSPDTWASYLDAAGYPKQSMLPPSYRAPAPTPLTPPRTEASDTSTGTRPPAAPAPPAAPPPAPGGIRF